MSYFISLDGLRAVAIAIVLSGHMHFPFRHSGEVGVDIFFVLSGFLITLILSDEAERFGRISFKYFYIRRFLRLYPCLVLACVIFVIPSLFLHQPFPFETLFITLTYTANWVRALTSFDLTNLSHCWSLGIEEQYYLVWPVVVSLLNRYVKGYKAKASVLLGLCLLLALYRLLRVGVYSPTRIYFALDTHMDGLVMGSALSYFYKGLLESGGFSALWSRVLSFVFAPCAFIGLFMIMSRLDWLNPWMERYGFFLTAILSGVVILDLVASRYSLFHRILSLRGCVFIGKISYGLYLLHFLIFRMIDEYFPALTHAAVFKIAIVILAASLSYYLMEKRFLELKRYFNKGFSSTDGGFRKPISSPLNNTCS